MIEISIIVPVYNTEKYLRNCIESILNQSFKSFELILIDDGSSDNSGKICDEYALKDSRIKVIHKNNGGVSSARNIGLDTANGKYIGFVDSDDWIESDMYELMHGYMIKNEIDLVNFGIKFINEEEGSELKSQEYKPLILNKKDMLKKLLKKEISGDYIVLNLFKRELFKKIRFREGSVYEDLDIFYQILDKTNKVLTVGVAKYNYYLHTGSITNIGYLLDLIEAKERRFYFIKSKYPDLKLICGKEFYFTLLEQFNRNLIVKEKAIVIKKLKKYYIYGILNEKLSLKEKFMLSILKINKDLYDFINKIR